MKQGIIQIEDKFYQKASLLLAPTSKADGALIKYDKGNYPMWKEGYKHFYTQEYLKHTNASSYSLHILSREKPGVGDWVRHTNTEIGQITELLADDEYEMILLSGIITGGMRLANARKIIATTDKRIYLACKHCNAERSTHTGLCPNCHRFSNSVVARPSNQFLDAYIREYNKANIIEDVLVELKIKEGTINFFSEESNITDSEVKVAPDNTITIRSIDALQKAPLPDIYSGTLNSQRIRRYKMVAEEYNITETSVSDIFCKGADWYKSLIENVVLENMQYYMEYCQSNGYVTPKDWLEKHKHF